MGDLRLQHRFRVEGGWFNRKGRCLVLHLDQRGGFLGDLEAFGDDDREPARR